MSGYCQCPRPVGHLSVVGPNPASWTSPISPLGGSIVFGLGNTSPRAGSGQRHGPSRSGRLCRRMEATESMSAYDFWTYGGSKEFGLVPAGILDTTGPTPICLQRGDSSFGETHIRFNHGTWVNKHASSVAQLVWKKCRQSGQMFATESGNKLKIAMRLSPDALMILRYIHAGGLPFFTVVSLYPTPSSLDGDHLGRYTDTLPAPPPSPVFSLPPLPAPVVITVRKKRVLIRPSGGDP